MNVGRQRCTLVVPISSGEKRGPAEIIEMPDQIRSRPATATRRVKRAISRARGSRR